MNPEIQDNFGKYIDELVYAITEFCNRNKIDPWYVNITPQIVDEDNISIHLDYMRDNIDG